MQALLAAHSKSDHFNPTKPDMGLITSRGVQRNEVGLVQAICVKVRVLRPLLRLTSNEAFFKQEHSSAQRKELFKNIQLHDEDEHIVPTGTPKQLLMDMKVHWSSMYVMLERAESLKEVRQSLLIPLSPFSLQFYRMSTTLLAEWAFSRRIPSDEGKLPVLS